MRKLNTFFSRLSLATVVCGIALATQTSCVKDEYDISDDNLDKNVAVGGSLAIPLGNTTENKLKTMLEDADIEDLKVNENGVYEISILDQISDNMQLTDSGITVPSINVQSNVYSQYTLSNVPPTTPPTTDPELESVETTFNNETIAIDINTSIPDELSRIDSIQFQGKVTAEINVEFIVKGIEADMSFKDYTVQFPDFVKFAASEGIVDNKFVINAPLENKGNYTYTYRHSLKIESFDFTKYPDLIQEIDGSKYLIIKDVAITGGDAKLENATINSEADNKISGTVAIAIKDMSVSKVYGIVDPEIEIESSTIDLSDLSNEFDGDFSAVLTNPSIDIEISNTITIPLEISKIELLTKKDGAEIQSIATNEIIEIAAASEDKPATSKIRIVANESMIGKEADVQYVVMNNFSNILMGLPDEVEINIDADVKAAESGENYMVDLTKTSYEFKADYSVRIPFEFNVLELEYTAEITDLNGELDDVLDYISTLELELNATSTLPIDLEIESIEPIGISGNVLDLPSMVVEGKQTIKANSEGSIIRLKMSDKNDQLKELDKLNINIRAVLGSSDSSKELRPEQYFKLGVKAYVPDGLNFNLDDM